ncbi:MAG TPA: cyclase family protein [Pseudomonas xinjiangensis]|uniref:Cyclase family protein n=2 Tax=root TaxID=1 RepID=A0A7V1BLP2_9GAMM|nr:cyclase family protein [Halopseudomonas xinjiangensis]HEC47068.1 cyclase family protein [Halopseudomonas xinjiangensis]
MRWKKRPEGSNWGEFGADDELGRLNLLTPKKVLQGVAEVRDGLSFCLSLPLDFPGGNALNRFRHPPRRFTSGRAGKINYNFALNQVNPAFTDVVSDDAVLLYTQYSTQWDALSHVGGLFDADGDGEAEALYYNGWRAGVDVQGPQGHDDVLEGVRAERLGIEKMAETAVSGRAVMIDLEKHCGRERVLVGHARLMQICEADGVVVEPGDMVCLYTGFADVILEMNREPDAHTLENSCAVLDGRDPALLQWITESGLSVLIADNYAVEAYPARAGGECCAALPLHEHCLFKLGIHLGELWYLTALARHLRESGRSRFMLTAPPLRLPGAVGSPVSPVALV